MRLFARIGFATVVLAATSADAAAQSFLCSRVRPGDTASAVAWRLTGRADDYQQPWFRIVDGATERLVPKRTYDQILSGYQACVPAARFTPPLSGARPAALDPTRTIRPRPVSTTGTSPVAAAPALSTAALASRFGIHLVGVELIGAQLLFAIMALGLFGAAMSVGWESAHRSYRARASLKREAHFFGRLFVSDFARPLIVDDVPATPIHAQLRWVANRRRLDIRLAPSAGRRYPNLEDHRRNVEYDVERIARRLRHHPFVQRPLRAEGQWVVVPFQLKAQAGGQS